MRLGLPGPAPGAPSSPPSVTRTLAVCVGRVIRASGNTFPHRCVVVSWWQHGHVGILVQRVLTIAFAGLAVVVLVAAVAMVGERLWRVMRGHSAMATVVDVKIEHGEEQSLLYVPVVDFVTRDGQRYTGVVLKDPLGRKPRIGRRVRVIYRPRNPAWVT